MKKSTLALSVAAVLGGLGFVGSASAIGTVGGATAALTDARLGTGNILLFPYFTAQSDNATLFSITNNDATNGKVVKVRFRGAANSDDLYDFTLFLSPSDVWTASVTKDAATGVAKLVSTDKSCVLPVGANNGLFSTLRTDPQSTDKPNQTREGYVEVITMADVPVNLAAGVGAVGSGAKNAASATSNANALFSAIKHASGTPTCAATALDNLKDDPAVVASTVVAGKITVHGADSYGMVPPTSGISGDWIIINQLNTAAWSGAARALTTGAGAGNLVFWPQISGDVVGPATYSADPLFLSGAGNRTNDAAGALTAGPVIKAQNFDLPDLSTPYGNSGVDDLNPGARAEGTSTLLAKTGLQFSFVTDPAIGAVTDVLLSQPTRRYHVAVNYGASDTTGAAADTTGGTTAKAIYRVGTTFYPTGKSALTSRQVCVNSVAAPAKNALFDREETTPTTSTAFVISPNTVTNPTNPSLCGETSVLSINQGGVANPSAALSATVARSDITFDAAYVNGWATLNLSTANGGVGLPLMSYSFLRARNGTVNYGFSMNAR